MKIFITLFYLLLGIACGQQSKQNQTAEQAAESSIHKKIGHIEQLDPGLETLLDPQARLEVIGKGYAWSEGPVWIKEHQFLLFSDIPNNIIYKWKEGEGITKYLQPSGYTGKKERGGEKGSNGLAISNDGSLLLCQHGDRRIARMDAPLTSPKPRFTTLVDHFNNKKINTPNDLVQHSNGSIYFTDPPYGFEKKGDDPARELSFQGVYRITPSGKLTLITEELSRPNGIALSPDEKTLYVSNSDPDNPLWMVFDVAKDGSTSNGRIFKDVSEAAKKEPGSTDGMTVDAQGYIYATGPGGIWVMTPDARVLGKIKTGKKTSNCAIGDGGKTLFVTADDYVLRMPLK